MQSTASPVSRSFTEEEVEALAGRRHVSPHGLLGLHPLPSGKKEIRLWRPGAREIYIQIRQKLVQLQRAHSAGLFTLEVPGNLKSTEYQVYDFRGRLHQDPYTFAPTVSELDEYLFGKGVHYQVYEKMGGRQQTHQGVRGVSFAVWAPNAQAVSVVGDFNHWNGLSHPLRVLGNSGIWELFIPDLQEGDFYKFEIRTADGSLQIKGDPYAYQFQKRPLTASVVADVDTFEWQDQQWLAKRKEHQWWQRPMNTYELHLGSWKLPHGRFENYRTFAHQLIEYCHYMGYTHVEFVSPSEHPLDESWGYQVTGYYAATSRHGSPKDFQYLVNELHKAEIGVLVDWVPGHFPMDGHALGRFDGTALYEHADDRKGVHPHWGTYIFNYGRKEVSNFLLANANFWFDKMHVDGLRVDAVASMLYLDYGRENSEWIPNKYGGNENLDAIEFFRHLNSQVHERFPGVLMIAEESTSFPGVTAMVKDGGLGFDLKWNMGWMNDTLSYFCHDPIYRKYHHNLLTFPFLYAFTERFTLVLSHDEVVHGKKSLLSKMPGDWWQKFANVRLLISLMMTSPGKKLLFQGGELGQWSEWSCKEEVHWYLLQEKMHQGLHHMVRELNHLYLKHSALWLHDHEWQGFEWVSFADHENGVISYLRKGDSFALLIVHHFTPNFYPDYQVPLKNVSKVRYLFNSDHESYGGSGKGGKQPSIQPEALSVELPPLASMIFEVEFYESHN